MAVPLPPTRPPIRNPPYPGGGPGTGGGGTSGGSTGGAATSLFVTTSNGGVFATNQVALYPCTSMITGKTEYRTFDPTQPPNDLYFPSSYTWRVEQLFAYANPSIRKLFWTFFDLGQVTVTWTITGVNEKQQVVTNPISLGVGNIVPTNAICTVEVDFNTVAMMNMQLSVSRLAGAGPLSILKVKLVGGVEDEKAT